MSSSRRPILYNISVESKNFRRETRTGIVLQTGQLSRLDFALAVGKTTESITVEDTASLLQTEDASVGAMVDERKVKELPMNGRQFCQLAQLVPNAFPPTQNSSYSVNKANGALAGTIGITGPLFAQLNEKVAEQMIANGFRSVVLMGDHGGGQQELADIAKKLDAKHASSGVRVVYCSDVYSKVGADFDKWLADNGYPPGAHASIKDTSELLYLGGDKGWVRKELIATAVGDPVQKRGEPRDPDAKRINNGISGDARRSTPEIGKRVSDLKVDYAVRQIRELLGSKP